MILNVKQHNFMDVDLKERFYISVYELYIFISVFYIRIKADKYVMFLNVNYFITVSFSKTGNKEKSMKNREINALYPADYINILTV